ncbi:tRNA lysidine(34) synthetase TilS [Niabella ginsengisoli]|uniref:tRNA lysidine(34) synthetase TilS n=1 Tax=Niabella ginsengisoli TaxID=522298 RepID=A0ABS9SHL5_9BACT|nr:tRNA lysidine(34) synthetase TilS [Niabella ginsengisoli]MCH5597649.1 tRNA lysidine(34) synthetase TilS [Niabella ginsengisoli]
MTRSGNDILIPVMLLKKTPGLRTVLLELLKPFGFNAPQLPDLIRMLDSDSGKYMLSASHRILKDRKHLIISSLKTIDNAVIVIENEGSFAFANGMIKLIKEESNVVEKSEYTAVLDAARIQYPLLLRPWKMGDYFYPLGMTKKKKLSRFLIDKKLSLTDKEKVWVIEMNKKIIWVVGLRIDDRFKITDNTKSILKISFITAS